MAKLYVIGIGPGDPELLTLKAVRIIKETPVICVPKGREEGSSLALSIVEKAVSLKGKEIIEAHFPMRKTKIQGPGSGGQGPGDLPLDPGPWPPDPDNDLDAKWDQAAQAILSKLSNGKNVAFLTLGDPAIYSTFYYLYDKLIELCPEPDMEIVPGVSSINLSAARAKISLGLADEKIAILPANYMGDLRSALETFDTVVLMKVHKVFDQVLELLKEMRLLDKAAYVCRAGMEDEKIFKDISSVRPEDLNYFSMVIVRK
ncbi:MAG: precorrin-2 C(20)-methyltransferase [Nitrospirae bacterium]|nr:precorrin-2 C(20)-methyltransferase [Nitrospirota bacterium]